MWLDFDCVLRSYSEDEDEHNEVEYEEQLQEDINIWLEFCRMTDRAVRDYIRNARRRIRRNPRASNGHMFMIEALDGDGQISYHEFRMYPDAFIRFTHVLRNEYGLYNGTEVSIYEQVGMFLCILAHRKGYIHVRTMFRHSLETIGHYFKLVLHAVVKFGGRLIKPEPKYNLSPPHHWPKADKHLMFQVW
ncbi:DDE Tnp4 domain-containing protein [Abeliophyllum distichum]|uniref:DDE Tnp4 domain-containing protein n=1 Tax=Abeliophyllum distichum TaxID=126358 RepID=A0ABD1VYA7_9LAMI